MYRGFQENLRQVVALSCLLGLGSVVHAGLIPDGTDILFSTSSYSVYTGGGGIHFMAPDNVYSSSGKVYLTNNDLLKAYNPARWFMSFGQGCDALALFTDPTTGNTTTYFSTGRTFYSRTYGKNIGEGDLLNRNGTIVATNQNLLAKFTPNTTNDMGLDAVDVVNPGANQDIWFSTRTGFHSNTLGQDIGAGDLLSNSGKVVLTNADLLKAFAPASAGNYGLDALHVISDVPGQTPVVLFSTNKDFYSNALKRQISQGDILSSTGEVVMTNAQLLKNFGWHWPNNPGLDAIAFYPPGSGTNVSRVISPSSPKDAPVPEPATLCLLAISGMLYLSRKRNA